MVNSPAQLPQQHSSAHGLVSGQGQERKKKKCGRVSLHLSAEVPPSSRLDRTGVSPVVFAPLWLLEYLCESSIGTHSHGPSTKFVGEMNVRAEGMQKTARQVSRALENRTL